MTGTLLAGALIAVLLPITRMTTTAPLTARQQALVSIAAYTTTGDLCHLRTALAQGLEAGLHIGLTPAQLRQLIELSEAAVGQPQADAARAVLANVLAAPAKH